MKLHDLKPNKGSQKSRIRLGRGNGSGKGTYSGRGMKGQKSRSGGGVRVGFEGGQTPLLQRMPKRRGFKNPVRIPVRAVNLKTLEQYFNDGETVSLETLKKKNVIRKNTPAVKILSDGTLSKKLIFENILCSESARKKIEKSGGTVPEMKLKKTSPKKPTKEETPVG